MIPRAPVEYKVVALRECGRHEMLCETPADAAMYWQMFITQHPYFNPEVECLVAIALDTRQRIKGHNLVAIGTINTVVCHAREIFRAAIIAAANAVVIMHNHPSGNPDPSKPDIEITRQLIRAGKVIGIKLHDHIIMGRHRHVSIRSLKMLRF